MCFLMLIFELNMRLEIEDFIEADVSSAHSSNESRLKNSIKAKFDSFYKQYSRVSTCQHLPELQLSTLKTMLINESNHEASNLAAAECDQIWQQVALSCNFVESGIRKSARGLTKDNEDAEGEEIDDEFFEADEDLLGSDLDGDLEDFENDIEQLDGDISDNLVDDQNLNEIENEGDDDEDSEVSEELNFGDGGGSDDLKDPEGSDEDFEYDAEDQGSKTNEQDDDNGLATGQTKESVFEDDFLKIDELEAFLDQEDAKDERLMMRLENPHMYNEDDEDGNENEGENEELVDYFSSVAGDDNAKYSDFFDHPSGRGRNNKEKTREKRSVTFANEDQYENEDSKLGNPSSKKPKVDLFGNENDSDVENMDEESLSIHERRMQKYREKIEQIEEQSLAEKPWQLMGEATAAKRPTDSLLAEVLTYDSSARLPPEITTEKTLSLEQILLQRIKDKTFDDVRRKFRPKEMPFEYRKRILLEQDKSKMSLAEVYEQEFLKEAREEKTEEKNEKHEEIRELMKKVFYRLDMLSHFSLTPQEPSSEMKLVKNAPAVSLEEAVPVALADSAQLAPEEVRKVKESETKALNERSKTDKLRQRRHKKAKQKAIAAREEQKLDPNSKEKAMLDLKKASRGSRDLKIVSDTRNSGNVTGNMTSTAFFSQLNDQQKVKDSSGASLKSKKKDSNKEKGASKFKL